MSNRTRNTVWGCTFALAAACNGIVGIEDVYEGPRPGSGGTTPGGGTQGEAGNPSNQGGVPSSADGGDGSVAPEGGSDPGSLGGAAGDGSSPIAGDGSGGAAEPEPETGRVAGHVIDFWRHPLPNISVQIGNTLVTTDKNGAFTVDDVPATYDVSMVYTYTSEFQVSAWAYLGLTRRDPTLQMYVGSVRRNGDLDVTFVPKPTLGANQKIAVAIGGKDGAEIYDPVPASGTSEFPDWYGPATASQTGHGLLWQTTATAAKLPTSYIAYKSALLQLGETDTTTLTLDLSPTTISSANIVGKVTPAGNSTRHNSMFLRFTSNATIQLVKEASAPDNFSYLAPSIPNSTLMVAADEGFAYEGYAVAYVDGLAPGAKPELTIPTPMTLAAPSGANVGTGTRFSFGGDTAGPYVVNLYSQDPDDPNAPPSRYQSVYVVSAKKQFDLPTFLGGGFTLYPNRRYIWTVATHGAYASMDALANEDGFLDPFSWDEEAPRGPGRDKGEFTDSDLLEFRTAP